MQMLIPAAVRLANQVHWGQVDKAGEPYIWHPMRVALTVSSTEEKIVGLLHDTVEDTTADADALLREIYASFGVEVGDAIKAISHRRNEPLDDYYARVKANPIALTVKIEDVWDNVGRLGPLRSTDEPTYLRLQAKYRHALTVLEGKAPWEEDPEEKENPF